MSLVRSHRKTKNILERGRGAKGECGARGEWGKKAYSKGKEISPRDTGATYPRQDNTVPMCFAMRWPLIYTEAMEVDAELL